MVSQLANIQAEGDRAVAPSIVITPPLTGCTTLAHLVKPGRFIIDADRVPGFRVRGLTLAQRKNVYRNLLFSRRRLDFACVPALPSPEHVQFVAAVVLIPAIEFLRRILALPDSPFIEGHRVAAIQWREEAIRYATTHDLPVYQALNQVPLLRQLSVG